MSDAGITQNFHVVHLAVTSVQRVPRTLQVVDHVRGGELRGLLKNLADAVRRLGGAGATHNAHLEVDRVAQTGAELDLQLQRVSDPTTPRAA
ncbi:MAG TPA: hypothetical protein VKU86_10000 [Acidimicrobiales bacterium]|nr:hypothetical protein [Acidimicrobiales bacterium]